MTALAKSILIGSLLLAAPAVALMAHYDSVPASTGASDDAAGVASALEIVRAIKARGVPARSGTLAGMTAAPDGAASAMLPHAWHSPQRPAHLGDRQPHSAHTYAAAAAALAMRAR